MQNACIYPHLFFIFLLEVSQKHQTWKTKQTFPVSNQLFTILNKHCYKLIYNYMWLWMLRTYIILTITSSEELKDHNVGNLGSWTQLHKKHFEQVGGNGTWMLTGQSYSNWTVFPWPLLLWHPNCQREASETRMLTSAGNFLRQEHQNAQRSRCRHIRKFRFNRKSRQPWSTSASWG